MCMRMANSLIVEFWDWGGGGGSYRKSLALTISF